MIFRIFLLFSLLSIPAFPALAAVNPDQYLTSGRAVDKERVFQELEPAQVLELARGYAARGQQMNFLDSLDVLARQAGTPGNETWAGTVKSELERFQAGMKEDCQAALEGVRKQAGRFDPAALDQALDTVAPMPGYAQSADQDQRAWSGRAEELLLQWRDALSALQGLGVNDWTARKDEAAAQAGQAARLKGEICQAADLDAARSAFGRMTELSGGMDGLGTGLEEWQWAASGLDLSGLDQRTGTLIQEAERLVLDRDALARMIMGEKVDVALFRLEGFFQNGPDMALISRDSGKINQALFWHGQAGTILQAHGLGGDEAGRDWRNQVRDEMLGYTRSPGDYAAKVRSGLVMPDGRSLSGVLQEVLAYRPEAELEQVILARAMVQVWKQKVDQLAVSYGNLRADLAEARDCLSAKAQAVSGAAREEAESAPATPPEQTPGPQVTGDSDTLADASDPADDFGDVPGDASVDEADANPQPLPAQDPASDPASDPGPQPVFGFTGVGISTRTNPTSTGYHVFAAGSQLGWSAALCRWSTGSADQIIADQLGRAADHVQAAHEHSLAPLVAWSNHTSIRAKLQRMADKLLAEGGDPNSSYRAQLAPALEREMGALAGGVAVQMIAGDKVHKENCESNYHRLGFHLAAAHQAFLMAWDMQRQGADQRLVADVLQDGRQSLRQARNAVYSLGDVVLATGRCADLSDLGGKLHKLTVEKDPEILVRDTGMLWREAEQRILAVSQGGPLIADPVDIKGLWAHDGDPSDTIRFIHKGGGKYVGVTEADGEVLRLTRYGDVYRGEGVFINEDGDGKRVWKPGVVLTVTGLNVVIEYEGMTLPMSRIGP